MGLPPPPTAGSRSADGCPRTATDDRMPTTSHARITDPTSRDSAGQQRATLALRRRSHEVPFAFNPTQREPATRRLEVQSRASPEEPRPIGFTWLLIKVPSERMALPSLPPLSRHSSERRHRPGPAAMLFPWQAYARGPINARRPYAYSGQGPLSSVCDWLTPSILGMDYARSGLCNFDSASKTHVHPSLDRASRRGSSAVLDQDLWQNGTLPPQERPG